jgi:hypothetical protein
VFSAFALITSVVSKLRPFGFIFSQRNRKVVGGQVKREGLVGDDSHVFGKKKKKILVKKAV